MKSEKNTLKKFGGLIHKYTIQDGVADGAIVPLIYEGRFVEQKVDEKNIDLWFQQTTKRLTESQRDDLARKWSPTADLYGCTHQTDRFGHQRGLLPNL